jgi:prepilin-type processing-associated H-X9-DG protein
LLPAIAQAKRKAQQTRCIANLHQLEIATQCYIADNEAYPVSIYWVAVLCRDGYLGTPPSIRILFCPSAQWYTNKLDGHTPISYSYNANGVAHYPQTESLGIGGQFINHSYADPPTRESDVVQPDDMMTIGDAPSPGTLFVHEKDLPHIAEYGNVYDRHQGKLNVLFCDGHIESPTLTFIEEDTSDAALVRWNRDHQPHRDLLPQ